jgi:L-rhamnose isomerase
VTKSPPLKQRYAARLNAFKAGAGSRWAGRNRISALDLAARAAEVPGLNAVDLNFPDHLDGIEARELGRALGDLGLALNGFAMRYYSEAAFKLGAFSHPDPEVRSAAIDLTLRGIDALGEAGGGVMTLWLGQDGFDYPLQIDYRQCWEFEIEGIRKVAAHNPAIAISLEYKPNEPRAFSILSDIGTTLLAVKEAGAANLGVTIDFAHVLYAGEMPAMAAMLAARHAKLLGVHLNDGYGKRDDGLMAGSINIAATLELLMMIDTLGYDSAIYFDTFPDASGLDPVAECTVNIEAVNALRRISRELASDIGFSEAVRRQDAVASRRILNSYLFGTAR